MSPTNIKEVERVMTICNACRYCEGFCAVFPAMERRRVFNDQDLKYLANLCHNCRGCYYACQYAPPHEFDINVPKSLGALRLETYQSAAFPQSFSGFFRNNGKVTYIAVILGVLLVIAAALLGRGASALFDVHLGENAFYQVVPYSWIVVSMSIIGILVLAALAIGWGRYWIDMGGTWKEFVSPGANLRAIADVLRLRYLDGGGHGCNYPDERFSMSRRRLHHLVFYGFLAALASTTIAMVYDHFLHLTAPYPFGSLPVILGSIGGLAMLSGISGLLYIKKKMDSRPTYPEFAGMDKAFLVVLFLTNLTGFLVLLFRETSAMGLLLAVHIGVVIGLFIMMPFGKFVHGIYRYAALVKNAIELSREKKPVK